MVNPKNQRQLVGNAGDTQGRTYDSARRVFDGWWHGWRFSQGSVAKILGNRNVPELNKDGSKRNLNLNWWNNDWNPVYRFLAVRYFHDFSRPSTGGSFVLQLLAPSAEHPADFCEMFRQVCIFFRIKRLHLPRKLQKEF